MSEISLLDAKIKGVGEKSAEKLMVAGFNTLADLMVMQVDELSATLGINKMKAREIINAAKSMGLKETMTLMTHVEHKEQITDLIYHYTTGSNSIDGLIGGGIATNELTGLRGAFSTGKSQMCFSVAVSCVETGRKVAWVETEPGTFKEARLYEIAKARGVEIGDEDVYVIPAKLIGSPNAQFNAYQRIGMALEEGVDIGLIIIDSFSPKFREFYTKREMFPARAQETMRHIGFLQRLAANWNLAVIMTVQVMGIPDAGKQLQVKKTEFSDTGMYGGHILKHNVQTWIAMHFQSKSANIWQAKLFDSSYMDSGVAEFSIGPGGVQDIQARRGRG